MVASVASLRMLLSAVVLLVLMALPAFSADPIPTPIKFIFNGYVQGRYSDTLGDNIPGTFEAKRAYANLRVDVDEHISAGIMASGLPTVSVLEAYGEYRVNPDVTSRLGLYRVPFGYETPLSSSRLITLERSQVSTATLYKDFTFDRGLYAYYTPVGKRCNLSAGLTNGTMFNVSSDTNDKKNFVSRLGYSIPGGQVGASVYTGDGPTNQPMQRYGLDLTATLGDFTLISEVIASNGTNIQDVAVSPSVYVDTTAQGGYATLAYRPQGSAYQPYVRFDTYDPNTDAANDMFNRTTVGVNYYLRGNNRFTVEYQTISDDLKPGVDGFIGVQYQVVF